jgi:hypothetical protein
MTPKEIFATVIGVLAVAVMVFGFQQKKRGRIIACNAVSRVLYILQYLLLGAFEGAALDLFGALATLLAGQKNAAWMKKYRRVVFLGVDALIIGAGMLLYRNLFSLLPIVGVLLHTGALWLEDEKKIRAVSLSGSPFWLVYNLYSRAYGSVVGDISAMLSIAVAMLRYDVRKKEKNQAE